MSETKTELPAYYKNARPELTQLVNPTGWRVLEVGCAAGAMGAELLKKGALEVVGIDLFEPALIEAQKRLSATLRVDLNTLPDLPYQDGHFDLITFADVLEHLPDPAAVLRHLRRWLKDDGRILISIPNVRHESVVLPLLVEGKWEYADWGILDRTHLRFFTRKGLIALLEVSGFSLLGKMAGVQTGVPSYIEKALELVKALGGDANTFLDECDVIQFVAQATPTDRRFADRPAPPKAADRATLPPANDPWAGSRRLHVLLVPDLENAQDCWAAALPYLASGIGANPDVTLGIALPKELLSAPPAPIRALVGGSFDLLLTEFPRTKQGWEALLRGTNMLAITFPQPEMSELAKKFGAVVHDVRTDPRFHEGASAPPAHNQPRS